MVALLCVQAVGRCNRVNLALATPDDGSICAAQPCRQFSERIEHGLQVERGAADHLEHIAGRGQLPRSGIEFGLEPGFRSSQFVLLATRLRELSLQPSFRGRELAALFLELTDELGNSCFESNVGSFHAEAPSS